MPLLVKNIDALISRTKTKFAVDLSVLTGRKELVVDSFNGKVQDVRVFFPTTTLQIPAIWPTGAAKPSGSDPNTGPFWPEQVLRTCAFHLKID